MHVRGKDMHVRKGEEGGYACKGGDMLVRGRRVDMHIRGGGGWICM